MTAHGRGIAQAKDGATAIVNFTDARNIYNNRMGDLSKTMGEFQGARSYFENALAIFKKVLGEAHSSVKVIQKKLSALINTMENT